MGKKKDEDKVENVKDFQKSDKTLDRASDRKAKGGDKVEKELRKWAKDVDKD